MVSPELMSVSELINVTYTTFYATHTIDDPSNLRNDKVFLFSGTRDTVVVQGKSMVHEGGLICCVWYSQKVL